MKNSFLMKIIAKDCCVVILLSMFFLSIIMFVVSKAQREHKRFMQKVELVYKDVKSLEIKLGEIRRIIPAAFADRWSRSMQKIYDEKLIAYISDPINNPRPNVDQIQITTPVIQATQRP